MENNHIDDLLKKYFEAETSVEEEKVLKEYFGTAAISERHKEYEHLFSFLKEEELKPNEDFDARLMQALQSHSPEKGKLRTLFPSWLKVAAMVIFIASAAFLGYQIMDKNKFPDALGKTEDRKGATFITIDDTYDDPELAKEQLEKALALLGDKLNKGRELTVNGVEKLEVMDKAIGN